MLAFPSALRLDLGDAESLDDATSGRYELMRGGVDLAGDRPLWGWGSGAFAEEYLEQGFGARSDAVSASHTIPLTVAAEQGADRARRLPRAAGGGARAAAAAARATIPTARSWPPGFVAVVVHTWLYAAFLEDPVTWTLLAVGAVLARRPRSRRGVSRCARSRAGRTRCRAPRSAPTPGLGPPRRARSSAKSASR